MSFAKEIWGKFSKMDVGEHTEKRGQFTFLSWTWAWAALMDSYPESHYDISDPVEINGTMEMRVSITVKDGDKELTRTMWLPVMDYKNKAIANPGSRDVSDARMRCLVKCLAMFGLGHYIYAGQDLPKQEKEPPKMSTPKQRKAITVYDGHGHLPLRRKSWLEHENDDGTTNWDRVTFEQANTIIDECKELEKSELEKEQKKA